MEKRAFIGIISALIIALVICIIFLVYALINLASAQEISNNVNNYSYTKAICEENFCQDYIISCNGTKLITKEPITGAAISLPKGWQDPRERKLVEGFCNITG